MRFSGLFAISAADDVIQVEKREGPYQAFRYLPSGKCRVSNKWLLNVRFDIVSTPREGIVRT
jgi:hypothetical protein